MSTMHISMLHKKEGGDNKLNSHLKNNQIHFLLQYNKNKIYNLEQQICEQIYVCDNTAVNSEIYVTINMSMCCLNDNPDI